MKIKVNLLLLLSIKTRTAGTELSFSFECDLFYSERKFKYYLQTAVPLHLIFRW